MSDFDLVVTGDVVLANRVVNNGFVAVRDGRVVQVNTGTPPQSRDRHDARGCWIIPGVVDGQVHTTSQLGQEGPGMASRAAAAGGITTIVDMPYDEPQPITNAKLFRDKINLVERISHVDCALYATVETSEQALSEIPGLIEAGACAFKFSTYTAHPTRFPRMADDLIIEAARRIAPSGLSVGVHNQDQEISQRNIDQMSASGDWDYTCWGRANTADVENLATARIYEIAALTGARMHVVHASLSRGFELCNSYKASGHKVSIETCIQYLMLNEEEHVRRHGARAKHYPPIRPKAEMEQLWTHIAAGHCDFVSSDHVSWGLERKGDPNFFKNSSGGPGLESLLPAFWTGCETRGLSPSLAVRQLSTNPARHFGLAPRKGDLTAGHDADVVVLERGNFPFDPSRSLSAVQWSTFDGYPFTVRVAATYVRGRMAYDGTQMVNAPGEGRFVAASLTSVQ